MIFNKYFVFGSANIWQSNIYDISIFSIFIQFSKRTRKKRNIQITYLPDAEALLDAPPDPPPLDCTDAAEKNYYYQNVSLFFVKITYLQLFEDASAVPEPCTLAAASKIENYFNKVFQT